MKLRAFVLALLLGLPSVRGASMTDSRRPLRLRLATIDAIASWAEETYLGYDKFEFASGEKRVVIIIGLPTSGLAAAEIVVFSRVADGAYALMLVRSRLIGHVDVAEVTSGIQFSISDGRPGTPREVLLLLPWTGVFPTAIK